MDEHHAGGRAVALRSAVVGLLLLLIAWTVGEGGPLMAVMGATGTLTIGVSLITLIEDHRRRVHGDVGTRATYR